VGGSRVARRRGPLVPEGIPLIARAPGLPPCRQGIASPGHAQGQAGRGPARPA